VDLPGVKEHKNIRALEFKSTQRLKENKRDENGGSYREMRKAGEERPLEVDELKSFCCYPAS